MVEKNQLIVDNPGLNPRLNGLYKHYHTSKCVGKSNSAVNYTLAFVQQLLFLWPFMTENNI